VLIGLGRRGDERLFVVVHIGPVMFACGYDVEAVGDPKPELNW